MINNLIKEISSSHQIKVDVFFFLINTLNAYSYHIVIVIAAKSQAWFTFNLRWKQLTQPKIYIPNHTPQLMKVKADNTQII